MKPCGLEKMLMIHQNDSFLTMDLAMRSLRILARSWRKTVNSPWSTWSMTLAWYCELVERKEEKKSILCINQREGSWRKEEEEEEAFWRRKSENGPSWLCVWLIFHFLYWYIWYIPVLLYDSVWNIRNMIIFFLSVSVSEPDPIFTFL